MLHAYIRMYIHNTVHTYRIYVCTYIHIRILLALTREDADMRNSKICRLSSFNLSISEL